jgi:hypothetical protein
LIGYIVPGFSYFCENLGGKAILPGGEAVTGFCKGCFCAGIIPSGKAGFALADKIQYSVHLGPEFPGAPGHFLFLGPAAGSFGFSDSPELSGLLGSGGCLGGFSGSPTLGGFGSSLALGGFDNCPAIGSFLGPGRSFCCSAGSQGLLPHLFLFMFKTALFLNTCLNGKHGSQFCGG